MSTEGVGHMDRASDPDPRVAMNIDVMSYLAAVLPANAEELVPGVARIVCRDVADCCAIAVLSEGTERLPAALCSLGVVAAAGATAWRLTRSRPVLLAMLLTAGLAPWLAVEGRVGFEVVGRFLGVRSPWS